MTALSSTIAAPQATAVTPDFPAIKARQKATWASGDYAVIGNTLQIVGESLCEAADLRAGEAVLDVAAGNGNATLAAARRWCEVTSTDYVPALLERGRERAAAERLHGIEFREADVEALPFDDGRFDVVLSTFWLHVRTEPAAHLRGDAARVPTGRPHRHGQLDAGRLHRPGLQDGGQARAPAGRRELSRDVGHA
jgi:SAM-dependent methyltransferase